MLPALRLHAMCSHETRARRSALLPFGGSDRPMLPPSIRFDTAIGEGLTPAGASRDQRLALVRRRPLRCDRHHAMLTVPLASIQHRKNPA